MIVHHRLRLLAFPTRASAASMLALADHETSRFPSKERLHMPVSKTTPGRRSRYRAHPCCLPSPTTSAPRMRVLSRLNGWPMRSPVNASPIPSRVLAHDSGSMRGRYSFIVMDLHHLLLAGLPAHSGLPRSTDTVRPPEHFGFVPKSDISLSGHPKDLSFNSKPRGFFLQPGGAQNLAW